MTTTWVLVADEAIARILERPRNRRELIPVEELTDPDAHARESELRHGPYGRRAGAGDNGGGSAATVSAGDSERHQHAKVFAARIAGRLAQCHREQRFDALHVIAAPRQLGYLRQAFDASLSAAVVETIDKDLVHDSERDLAQRLFGARDPRA